MHMHLRAMVLEGKESASSMMEYAPIARSIAQANLSEADKLRIKKRVDIVHMIAKENLVFTKMGSICKLEERHGKILGSGYKNGHSCAILEFIACEQAESLVSTIRKCHFSTYKLTVPQTQGTLKMNSS